MSDRFGRLVVAAGVVASVFVATGTARGKVSVEIDRRQCVVADASAIFSVSLEACVYEKVKHDDEVEIKLCGGVSIAGGEHVIIEGGELKASDLFCVTVKLTNDDRAKDADAARQLIQSASDGADVRAEILKKLKPVLLALPDSELAKLGVTRKQVKALTTLDSLKLVDKSDTAKVREKVESLPKK